MNTTIITRRIETEVKEEIAFPVCFKDGQDYYGFISENEGTKVFLANSANSFISERSIADLPPQAAICDATEFLAAYDLAETRMQHVYNQIQKVAAIPSPVLKESSCATA